MENLNNNNTQDEQNKPKPTEDAGAQIETVTPDTEKEGKANNRPPAEVKNNDAASASKEAVPETDHGNKDIPEIEKENKNPENPELDAEQKDGSAPDVETVSA